MATPNTLLLSFFVDNAKCVSHFARRSSDHFTFPTAPGNVNFISAVGDSVTIAYHSGRSVGSITLIPSGE